MLTAFASSWGRQLYAVPRFGFSHELRILRPTCATASFTPKRLCAFGQEQSYWIALQFACKRTLGFESVFDGTRISNLSPGRMRIAGSSLHRRLLTGRSKLRLELGFMMHQYPLLSANLIHEGFGGG